MSDVSHGGGDHLVDANLQVHLAFRFPAFLNLFQTLGWDLFSRDGLLVEGELEFLVPLSVSQGSDESFVLNLLVRLNCFLAVFICFQFDISLQIAIWDNLLLQLLLHINGWEGRGNIRTASVFNFSSL